MFGWIFSPVQAQQNAFVFLPPGPANPNSHIAVDANCLGKISSAPPTVTSAVGATITLSQFSPDNNFNYTDEWILGSTVPVLWDVADNMGHSFQFSYVAVMVDVTPPVFDVASTPSILFVNSIVQVPPLGAIPVMDNCETPITTTFSQTTPPPICSSGTFIRTWVATDSSGNAATYTQTITVFRDSLLPTLTVLPQNGSAPCEELPGAYTNWLAQQMAVFKAVDASGIQSYSNNAPPALADCPVPVTVTFTATDNCGFFRSTTAVFSSSDTNPPTVLQAPKDTFAFCDQYTVRLSSFIQSKANAQIAEACSPFVVWTMEIGGIQYDSVQLFTILADSLAVNACRTVQVGNQVLSNVRAYLDVDFYATDACGNEAYVGQGRFAVLDTLSPVVGTVGTVTEECGAGNDQSNLVNWINQHGNNTVADACSPTSWINFSYISSDGQSGTGSFNSGPYPTIPQNDCAWFVDVTFRAADQCGNIGENVSRFQLIDTTAPMIIGFADTTTIYCPTPIPSSFSATVTDNCSQGLVATYTTQFADTICSGNYSLRVFWTAMDACGNVGSRTQVFLIRDTVAPQFTLVPANFTVGCDSFQLLPLPVIGSEVQATDICGVLQGINYIAFNNRSPDPTVCGHYNFEITRRYTATDQCGNTRVAIQLISVRDLTPPTAAIALADTLIPCQNLPLVAAIPPAEDNCSPILTTPVEFSRAILDGSCGSNYTIVVTWEARDVCGNKGYYSRNYQVVDTIAPMISGVPEDITVSCESIPAPYSSSLFTLTDNCDAAPVVSFLETEVRNPDLSSCEHWADYQLKREWTVTDECGNNRTYTQLVQINDTQAPGITTRDTVVLSNSPGICGALISIPAPLSAVDGCSVLPVLAVIRDTMPITGPPSSDAVCDTVYLSLSAPNLTPAQPISGIAVLTVSLDNADAEGMEEFFRVYGEQGYLIGQTAPSPAQCGNSVTNFSLPASIVNEWLSDGTIQLVLAPNGTGPAAINPICPGRRVRAEVAYEYLDPQVPLSITFSVDGGPKVSYPSVQPTQLSIGYHTIVYEASDCSGNTQTSSSVVRIDDVEAPSIQLPAQPVIAYTSSTDCISNWTVPLLPIVENCNLSGYLAKSSELTNVRFESNANAGMVPQLTTLTISGLVPNAFASGTLRIRHRGDNSDLGEFFRVLDEQNNFIGLTTIGTAINACTNFHESVLTVSAAQLNAWAANGSAQIKLVPNTDAINYTDFIQPCGTLNSQNYDGISVVQAILEYHYAELQYEIKNSQQVIVQAGQVVGQQTQAQLPAGTYTVSFSTLDQMGNTTEETLALVVRDTVKPVAICQNRTIFVSFTGSGPYVLTPDFVNNGSNDNCSGTNLSFGLSQTLFTCNAAGQIIPVTLTVTDSSGNSRSCVAQVRVETENISTSASANICEGGTAQLFANPPGNPINYTFSWSGPMFSSFEQSPILVNAQLFQEGTYTVTVTGPTGCTAVGSTQLQLIGLPVQPVLSGAPALVCLGQSYTLTTAAYAGTSVSYQWYVNGIDSLIATTIQPNLAINNPAAGQYNYFVRVVDLDCASALSAPLFVRVQAPVAAVVNAAAVSPCEGDPVVLGTPIQGPGITYLWTGPGYGSLLQYPVPFSAQLTNSGTYTLVISANGCPGIPATVNVVVRDRPEAPIILGESNVCVGSSVVLTAQPPIGNPFLWISPDADTLQVNGTNALTLGTVALADSGFWKVISVLNGCASPVSLPHLVSIQDYPIAVANANTPLCQGGVLYLEADVNNPNVTYSWSGPNNFMAFTAAPTHSVPATGNYTVTVSTPFGCQGISTVAVNVVPSPVITSVTSNAPSCVDGTSSIQLFHTLVSNNGPFSYTWTFPNGTISTDTFPVIPSATSAINGNYTLIVRDAFGCVSAPLTTTINVQDRPVMPIISQPVTMCEGPGVVLLIQNAQNYLNGNFVFIWETPQGQQVTVEPSLSLPATTINNEGNYSVQVLRGDCLSNASAPVFLDIIPKPAPPVVQVNSPVCEGATLQFVSTVPPGVVVDTWTWEGPASFANTAGNTANPTRSPVELSYAGVYTVRVTANGCISEPTEPIVVQVKPRPLTPVALSDGNVCRDQADTLVLRVASGSQTPLATYQWINNFTQLPLDVPSLSPTYTISDLSSLAVGQNPFRVVAILDGCVSFPSFIVSVVMDTIPNVQAVTAQDYTACDNLGVAYLGASFTSIGVGRWTQVGGPSTTVLDPSSTGTQAGPVSAGNTYSYEWSLSNGACKNFSRDTLNILVVSPEPAIAMADVDTCFATGVQLRATQGTFFQGSWSQPASQAQIQPPIVIADPTSPTTMVTGLPAGASNFYYFIWTVNSLACDIDRDTVVVRVIGTKPNAGPNRAVCTDDDCVNLQASPLLPSETGLWKSLQSNISFTAAGSSATEACGLFPGENTFIWETNGGLCGNLSRDTVVLTYEQTPVALPDTVQVDFGTPIDFNILTNDLVPNSYSVNVISRPSSGILTNNGAGNFNYLPDVTYTGIEEMIYRICNLNCTDTVVASQCDVSNVVFEIGGATDCEIPSLITPNGDNVNDVFFIPCLNCADCLLDNELTIFNQWGDHVFHAKPYQQNWKGTYNGEDLPVGSYYYVLKYVSSGSVQTRTGFIIVQR